MYNDDQDEERLATILKEPTNFSFPFLPNKQGEIDRLYVLHIMLKYAWKNNFGAPVQDLLRSDSGAKVLDVGCGSGLWTLEMATEFPLAKFYGLDSVPSFPDTVLPDNVEFVEANLLNTLPFRDAEFDYVFSRDIMFSFQMSDFDSIVMKEILRIVKPGGYIEFVESELEGRDRGKALERFNEEGLMPWFVTMNIDYTFLYRFKEYLLNINQLKDVTEQKVKIPIGGSKRNGFIREFAVETTMQFVRTMAEFVMPFMKLTHEEYLDLVKEIESEFRDENSNCYFWYRRFIAMKT